MSIRKAHGAILFYQASSQSSFKQLYDVAHDFQMRKGKFKVNFDATLNLLWKVFIPNLSSFTHHPSFFFFCSGRWNSQWRTK